MMDSRVISHWRVTLWVLIAVLLLAPLVAMQFTQEVRWTGSDFAVAAALLIGAAVSYELAARIIRDRRGRVLLGGGLLLIVALMWAHGAVGIF
jgi:hypothetical protein